MIWNSKIINRLIFYPQETDVAPTRMIRVDGAQLGCYYQQPFPEALIVLYFCGNGELASDRDEFTAPMFHELGLNTCFCDYRGYGRSTDRPKLSAMMADGICIMRELRLEPQKTVIFGRSIGSLFAVELASKMPDIAGLIIESGIANLLEIAPVLRSSAFGKWIGRKLLPLTPINQQSKMRKYAGPLLVMHCLEDFIVPADHAIRLFNWKVESNKTIKLFTAGFHNTIQKDNELQYQAQIKQFIDQIQSIPK